MAHQRKADYMALTDKLSAGYPSEFISEILKPSGRSGQYATRDYIKANAILAELNKVVDSDTKLLIKKRTDVKKYISANTLYRLNIYSPCLAYRYDELKDPEKEKLFTDPAVVFTEKQNGIRGIFVHHKGVSKLYSRNYSVSGDLPEYFDNILQTCDSEQTIAFDCEIKYEPDSPLTKILEDYGIYTDSQLEAMNSLMQMNQPQAHAIQKEYKARFGKDLVVFRIISALNFNGKDFRERRLMEAYNIEKDFIEFMSHTGLNVKPIRKILGLKEEKQAFLNLIIDEEGGEGVVTHNLNGYYRISDKRDKTSFVKIKRSVGGQAAKEGMGDTIDAWVSGYKIGTPGTANENLVAALQFSITIVKQDGTTYEHIIANAPNLEAVLKKNITEINEAGEPVLKQEVYGLIGALSGQNISYRSKRLTHPRMLEFPRMDKSANDCIYSENWINSQLDFQSE